MKKVIYLAIFIGVIACAQTDSNIYEKAYVQLSSIDEDELNVHKSDKDYVKGLRYLFDEEIMDTKEFDFRDPEDKNAKPNLVKRKVPNISKAIEYFEKSVDKNQNPLSAYSGMYLINTYVGKKQFVYLKKFKKFATVLFNDKNRICQAYLFYGEIFEKGLDSKINRTKAIAIYEDGQEDEKCKKGWELNVLGGKIWTLKNRPKKAIKE